MGNKTQCLENLQQAENSHKQAMHNLDIFLRSYALNPVTFESKTPLNKTECLFGQWFYTQKEIKSHLGVQLYEKIDALHTNWHQQYAKIYEIFFQDNKKKSFLGKLFHKNNISESELDRAKAYYDDLQTITNSLLNQLQVAKRRITAMSDSKFD
jgi:magnesium-transporting ATPase (P-type)